MDDAAAADVMKRFGKAFFSRDPAALAQVLTDDAEWHFAFGSDAPDGRVRRGVDGYAIVAAIRPQPAIQPT